MAYFANGTEGVIFDAQCDKCKFGQSQCPIETAQVLYNYDAANNKVATDILNTIVNKDGICQMRATFKKELATDGSIQSKLF